MDIGTAKPVKSELNQVPHHLIDIKTPMQTYNVAEFIDDCNTLIPQIQARNKLPLLVGGTMMYINALINGIHELPKSNKAIRNFIIYHIINDLPLKAPITYDTLLHTQNDNNDNNDNNHNNLLFYENMAINLNQINHHKLHDHLRLIDVSSSLQINPNDAQRIIRRLELYYTSNKTFAELSNTTDNTPTTKNKQTTPQQLIANNNILKISNEIDFLILTILPPDRELIKANIENRLDTMLQNGLIDELIHIQKQYPLLTEEYTSMRCIGYHETWQYLNNQITYAELQAKITAATRQLAKRQMTWLRKLNNNHTNINLSTQQEQNFKNYINVYNPDPKIQFSNIVNAVVNFINKL